jgi:D-lactate dehydrogenase
LKTGNGINKVLGQQTMFKLTRGIKRVFPAMPLWSDHLLLPPRLSALKSKNNAVSQRAESAIVYFPACISRTMGTYAGKEKNLMETFMSVCSKSGIGVIVLSDVMGSCCSQIFSSKGFKDASRFTANKIVDQLWKSSKEGALPIVIDVSSCAYTLHHLRPVLNDENKQKFDALTILDSVEFLHGMVMPFVEVTARQQDIVLHPVCSLQKMKTQDKFIKVAKHFAKTVTVPKHAGCCGMAGDRGFLFPELTASATHAEALEVKQKKYDGYYSSTKTCEIALSEAVREDYVSILYLVDEAME